jgi:diguanylate cyclase (GGDEF)-like protein
VVGRGGFPAMVWSVAPRWVMCAAAWWSKNRAVAGHSWVRRVGARALTGVRAARPDEPTLTDSLTGLANAQGFSEALAEQRELFAREGGFGWVLLADLDGFKLVNDTFGHPGGDEVLREVARRLERVVGDAGVVARVGGDEFAVLIRSSLESDALASLVSELERSISAVPVDVVGQKRVVELTVGAALLDHVTDPAQVQRRADERMYVAKRRAGSDPFDRVSELIVGLLDPSQDGVERALASGIAEVAQAGSVYVSSTAGEQWWPAEPTPGEQAQLRGLARTARERDDVVEDGEWMLAAPLRGDGVPVGAFAVERSSPFGKPDRIALVRTGVALGQALLRLTEGVAVRRRISELERLAFRDENTGLANRRALLAELERVDAATGPLALLFVDFDGLRAVNNQLSYEHGNDLLRTVAAAIEQTLQPGELAARLHGSGGDEFIVVAPGVDAPARAEALERTLEEVELDPAVAALYGGASVGYAIRIGGELPLELVERAASLMRDRKQTRKRTSSRPSTPDA